MKTPADMIETARGLREMSASLVTLTGLIDRQSVGVDSWPRETILTATQEAGNLLDELKAISEKHVLLGIAMVKLGEKLQAARDRALSGQN